MTSRAFLAALGASGLIASPAAAKQGPLASALGVSDDWQVSANVRARFEAIDNQFRATGPDSDSMLSLRTDVLAEYDAGPVRIGGEVQDSRVYGQAANSTAGTGEVNALEPVQAYLRLELGDSGTGAFGKGAKGGRGLLTLGRFTMDLGGRRLVARNRFRNTTNAFTGAQLDWTAADGKRLVTFWTMPQVRLPDDAAGIADNRVKLDRESTDLQFFGANASVPNVLGGTAEGYAFRLVERDRPDALTRNRRLWTIGGRLFRKPAPGQPDHDIEAAYQFGKARRSTGAADLTDLDVAAWFTHAEAGYTFASPWKPRISAMFDAASGDSGRAGHYRRFDTLFGARRSEFGPTSLYGAVGRANLVSPALRVEAAPDKRVDLMAQYRALWAENARDAFASTAVKDGSGASGRFAGHQIEGRLRYWIVPGLLQSDLGAAFLLKRGLLRDAPNARGNGDTAYGYLDLTLTL
ncbi:alginate export family protein [Novosphingobium sp. KCTC 2891]|uniref:alginate export family protein n=1 Tax=Novosphingobium sp. KCTC 2891 TaxID=2989730 RepID=UPI0022238535|nr:alginate export family protein [Novosphingobium sp. KCTC 2891]MCW1382104.1 alginate export family protein [Novosphingobium sp. KCTC 2891]